MEEKSRQINDIKKFRRKYYDTHARNYDEEWNEDTVEEFLSFKKNVSITPGDVVLDIATGTGMYLIHMAKSGAICYGIEQSPEMLKHLNLKIKKENLEQNIKKISVGVADDLHYPDQYFDWVTCIGMFEYYPLEYVKIVLREIVRVLKLDGYCFIDIPDPTKKYAQQRDWIFKYDLEKFETVVESAGLKIVTSNNAGCMLQYLFSKI